MVGALLRADDSVSIIKSSKFADYVTLNLNLIAMFEASSSDTRRKSDWYLSLLRIIDHERRKYYSH
jgi:hypothetical protein